MLKLLKYCCILAASAFFLYACSKEELGFLHGGEGLVAIDFSYDLDVRPVTRADATEDPVVFKIVVTNLDKGVVVKTIEDHTTLNGSINLREGNYEIKASNGTESDAAFDLPYYEGRDTVKVVAGETVAASITCTLARVKVTVAVTEAVKEYFSSYDVTVSNGNGASLLFKDEDFSRVGYLVNSGNLFCTLNIVNNDGDAHEVTHQIGGVQPRDYYHLLFDVDTEGSHSQGGVSIRLIVDDTFNEKEYDIDVNLNKKPKPIITEATGADLTNVLKASQGAGLVGHFDIEAQAGIEKIIVSHSSPAIASLGIPESFSLMDIVDSTNFAASGIHWPHPLERGMTKVYFDIRTLLSSMLDLGTYEFTINILDQQSQYVSQKVSVQIVPDMEVSTARVDAWARFAYVYGQYNTESEPEGMNFQYKKASDDVWLDYSGSLVKDGTSFSAVITGLESGTEYQFRATTTSDLAEGKSDDNIITATTEQMPQLPNFSFDNWYKDGDSWIPNTSSQDFFWDSGNKGANSQSWLTGANNPTSPESSFVKSGKAVKLETMVVFNVMAGGNIYAGSFGKVNGTSGATVNFGRPYKGRPTTLSGYYSYAPKPIDKYKPQFESLAGQNDIGKIFVVLTDLTSPYVVNNSTNPPTLFDPNDECVIAYGELEDNVGTGGEYKPFTINIEYRDNRKPSYVILVAVASKYADYFTGGVGSVMYIDEFSFGFDYVE